MVGSEEHPFLRFVPPFLPRKRGAGLTAESGKHSQRQFTAAAGAAAAGDQESVP